MEIRDRIRQIGGEQTLTLYDPHSIDQLAESPEIERLTLQHFPKIHSLAPIAKLPKLRTLFLITQVSWDGTNRFLEVESFEPLTRIETLEHLEILGVVPKRDGVTPFSRIPKLKRLILANTTFYQLEDFAYLSKHLPAAVNFRPVAQMNFLTACKKCKFMMLYLRGSKPGGKKYVCPSCHRKLILRHLERWNLADGNPKYDCGNMTAMEIYTTFRNPALDDELKRMKWMP
jgi:hypothetical protein